MLDCGRGVGTSGRLLITADGRGRTEGAPAMQRRFLCKVTAFVPLQARVMSTTRYCFISLFTPRKPIPLAGVGVLSALQPARQPARPPNALTCVIRLLPNNDPRPRMNAPRYVWGWGLGRVCGLTPSSIVL